jgi:uncharacterized damage-inducible protein DinB
MYARLEAQLESLDVVLARATPDLIDSRPASGDWSARENLAHLARHSTVFLERLDRILTEDTPRLGRYRAEDDPEWPQWSDLPLDEVLRRLKDARRRLIAWVSAVSPDQMSRTGLHPAFGAMTIPQWLEFFLLHEAHHLYTAMLRIAEARHAASAASGKQR